jgi:hypothetical protein
MLISATGVIAGSLVTTSITFGTATTDLSGPNSTSHTLTGHTSGGGDILVRMFGRCTTISLATISVTWNGVALVERLKVIAPRSGGAFLWFGTIKGGSTGNRTLAISTNSSMGKLIVRYTDLVDWSGAAGAADGDYYTNARTSASTVFTPEASGSTLVGMVGAVHGGAEPFTLSGSWVKTLDTSTGSNADTDSAAALGHIVGSTAGTPVTLSGSSATSTDDWAVGALELQ